MQQPGPDLRHGTVPGAPRSDNKTLFGLHLYLAERCCENTHSAKGLAQCKPAGAITRLV